jgi:hypothetical protein
VALWEALLGERPFEGTSLPELTWSVTQGKRRPAPRRARVPTKIVRAIERGLSVDPAQRWPTIEALVEQLIPRTRSWPWALATVALAVGVSAVVAANVVVDPCDPEAVTVKKVEASSELFS